LILIYRAEEQIKNINEVKNNLQSIEIERKTNLQMSGN